MDIVKKGIRAGNRRNNILDKLFGMMGYGKKHGRLDKRISWAKSVPINREAMNTLQEAEHTKAQAVQLAQRLQNR